MSHLRISALWLAVFALLALVSMSACSPGVTDPGKINVVVAENFWGSIVSQIGGDHVSVVNLIDNPNADPHDYEPTAANARAVADARYVVLNGAGYDAWIERLLSSNPSSDRQVLNIADLVGVASGGNPHIWYSPDYVLQMAQRVRDDLKAIDPANASDYDTAEQAFETTGLWAYHEKIDSIRSRYAGTKVGATESIFEYLAPALGLDLITPESYLDAVSEGQDIAPVDQIKVEDQVKLGEIAILVYNSQNTPPNISALLKLAAEYGIPQSAVTETMVPANASFQEWQTAQLADIADALGRAGGG